MNKKPNSNLSAGAAADSDIQPIVISSADIAVNPMLGEWASYSQVKPANYGRYLVYRKGCSKMHFETWNNTGWAYNNRDITHWCDVRPPFA